MTFEQRVAMQFEKKEQEAVELVLISDHSGSMEIRSTSSKEAFNKFIKDQKEVEGAANFTHVEFNEHVTVAPIGPIANANVMQAYRAYGGTALNDAIGISLTFLLNKNPKKAIVSIITDGEENSSKIFSREEVQELVKKAESKGWKVLYLAANQDAIKVGRSLGISGQTISNWNANNPYAAAQSYAMLSAANTTYRNGGEVKLAVHVDKDTA